MAYLVAAVSAWLALSAATALRPGRRGVFAALAFPVGWAAGELAGQALVVEGALVGALYGLGWPRATWLSALLIALAAVVVAENLALVAVSFAARRVVRRAMTAGPRRPLEPPSPREDRHATWWRTALQFPYHPRAMQLVRDVPYGPLERHRLDVWRQSTTPRGAPVIFYVHGGAWTMGDKREQGRPMLHELVARGWVAVSCNYRLAPRHPWPAQIEDVVRTLAWIKGSIHAYGGDPDRVVVAGGSAGGHLAALVALAGDDPAWRPPGLGEVDLAVRGAIPFYGVLEMTGDEAHWRGLGRGLRTLLEHRVVQRPYEGHERLYESLSPLHRIHRGAPPFLVVQGVNDTLVEVNVARAFVSRFREVALAPCYYVELPFTQHAFDVTASPRTSATTRAAVAFAEAVAVERPALSSHLLASYRVPPTILEVEVDGRWVSAVEAARRLGPLTVVSADNPYSVPQGDGNAARRRDLASLLDARGVATRPTRGVDPYDGWPEEPGVALLGEDAALARDLAAAFDQFAYYLVDESGARVHSARTGDPL